MDLVDNCRWVKSAWDIGNGEESQASSRGREGRKGVERERAERDKLVLMTLLRPKIYPCLHIQPEALLHISVLSVKISLFFFFLPGAFKVDCLPSLYSRVVNNNLGWFKFFVIQFLFPTSAVLHILRFKVQIVSNDSTVIVETRMTSRYFNTVILTTWSFYLYWSFQVVKHRVNWEVWFLFLDSLNLGLYMKYFTGFDSIFKITISPFRSCYYVLILKDKSRKQEYYWFVHDYY